MANSFTERVDLQPCKAESCNLQVLLSNAARLTPEYKQQCKREWGIEDTPFDVSFIVPTQAIEPRDLVRLGSTCASTSCNQLGTLRCARCEVCIAASNFTKAVRCEGASNL